MSYFINFYWTCFADFRLRTFHSQISAFVRNDQKFGRPKFYTPIFELPTCGDTKIFSNVFYASNNEILFMKTSYYGHNILNLRSYIFEVFESNFPQMPKIDRSPHTTVLIFKCKRWIMCVWIFFDMCKRALTSPVRFCSHSIFDYS